MQSNPLDDSFYWPNTTLGSNEGLGVTTEIWILLLSWIFSILSKEEYIQFKIIFKTRACEMRSDFYSQNLTSGLFGKIKSSRKREIISELFQLTTTINDQLVWFIVGLISQTCQLSTSLKERKEFSSLTASQQSEDN